MDGTPMEHDAVINSITLTHPRAAMSDIDLAIKELESDRLISRNVRELADDTWTLTDSGEHKAKQLG